MIDAVVTIATPDWADAVAVMAHGLATHGGLGDLLVVFTTEEVRPEILSKGGIDVVVRPLNGLKAPAWPWPPPHPPPTAIETLWLHKWALLGDCDLGCDTIAWLDADVLVRGDMSGALANWAPGRFLAAPSMTVNGFKLEPGCGGRALSAGLMIYEPSNELRDRVLDFASGFKAKPQHAFDQTILSRYLRTCRPHTVFEIPNRYHANTRARHYAPDLWAEVGGDDAALWHFAGPKPWIADADYKPYLHAPWADMFNEWRRTANSLGLGPYGMLEGGR